MITIDEANIMLDEIAEGMPKEMFSRLNGGIILEEGYKIHPSAIHNDLIILGEYVVNILGRYIVIYFGSFNRMYGTLSKEEFKSKLQHTLYHEFTHHLESLSGERGLEIEDEIFLTNYFQKNTKIK